MEPDNIIKAKLEVRGNLAKFFSNTKDVELILDGPAGSGKTRVALERQHLICCKYPNCRGLVTRKYRSSMNETCLQVLDKSVYADKHGVPYRDAPHWWERDQKYVYDNGSEIIVAGMDDPTKIMSSQYDWAYWNEVIEGKQDEWLSIMTRLRNGAVPYSQMLGDTNPGHPKHWIKQREADGLLTMYPTNHKDNPVYWNRLEKRWTKLGEDYVNRILRDSLSGHIRDRLYLGLWKAAEGLVYDMWNPDIHVVPRRDVPRHWPRYWVFDFGFVDPFVWIELVEDTDSGGILYLHRELYHTGMTVKDAIHFILDHSKGINPYALICDHDAEDRATVEQESGMLTLPAFKKISPGIQAVQHRLKGTRFGGKPGFMVMNDANLLLDKSLKARHKPTCTEEEFPNYQWDIGKMAQDRYKDLPIDRDNHGMDVVRYGIGFVDDIAIDPQETSHVATLDDIMADQDEADFADWTRISRY